MKKFVSALLLIAVVFSFTSCKTEEDTEREIPEEAKEIASQIEELGTRKDASVIENLTDSQTAFIDSLGQTAEGAKLIAYSDTENYTLVYSCEFKDSVAAKVMSYHIVKNDSYFNALKAGINAKSAATVDEENKIIKADKTNDYKSKTYDEMLKELSKYTVVE